MITWLDRLARICARRLDEQHHGGDPRRALAFYVGQILAHLAERRHLLDPAESIFFMVLAPFIREFLPPDETVTFLADGLPPPRPLGLLLTRPTANLLSAADSAGIRDELWRAKLGLRRAIYVDRRWCTPSGGW